MKNFAQTFRLLGILLVIESIFMCVSGAISLYYAESDMLPIGISVLITFVVGLFLVVINNFAKGEKIGKKQAFVLIIFSWIILAVFGAIPFVLTGVLPKVENALFETMSGITTTGSSVILDVESLSHGILFWRSTLQWLGGFAVITLTLAVLPLLGLREFTFLTTETKQSSSSKLLPRIVEIVNWLWGLYLLITIIEATTYYFAGMGIFDAVCHAFTTISTGGFSTKNNSVAFWNSKRIESAMLFFMFFSGVNFTLLFYAVRGKFRKIAQNQEFRYYVSFIVFFSLLLTCGMMLMENLPFLRAARVSVFHVLSVITTSGFLTQDYLLWPSSLTVLLFLLMFVGSSAGSASGGIKIIRAALLLKCSRNEFYKFMHPNAVLPVRFNNHLVPLSVLKNVFVFILLYIMMLVFGTFLLSCLNVPMENAFGYVLSAIGNVGYNVGMNVASNPIEQLPVAAKLILSVYMLIGRIDLYIFLLIFSRSFWKS